MLVRNWANWACKRIWTPFLLRGAAAAEATAAAVAAIAVAAGELVSGVEVEIGLFQGIRVTLVVAEVGVEVRVGVRVGVEGDLLENTVRRVKVFSRNIATLLEGMRRRWKGREEGEGRGREREVGISTGLDPPRARNSETCREPDYLGQSDCYLPQAHNSTAHTAPQRVTHRAHYPRASSPSFKLISRILLLQATPPKLSCHLPHHHSPFPHSSHTIIPPPNSVNPPSHCNGWKIRPPLANDRYPHSMPYKHTLQTIDGRLTCTVPRLYSPSPSYHPVILT